MLSQYMAPWLLDYFKLKEFDKVTEMRGTLTSFYRSPLKEVIKPSCSPHSKMKEHPYL